MANEMMDVDKCARISSKWVMRLFAEGIRLICGEGIRQGARSGIWTPRHLRALTEGTSREKSDDQNILTDFCNHGITRIRNGGSDGRRFMLECAELVCDSQLKLEPAQQ
ncbi:hypothetical protein [Thioalkalivibrio sulfidiphilus]|uniref:hypothetical protein n=1 Tax=Thioalkalivibrio sulfidiphilus TaxID=1033854 RepID=UPI0012DF29EA|nr:hypothetical protein [Thioalkalivibrio sulfidiphilus]